MYLPGWLSVFQSTCSLVLANQWEFQWEFQLLSPLGSRWAFRRAFVSESTSASP